MGALAAARPLDFAFDAEVRQAQQAYQTLIELARTDCTLFNELILRDEESGEPVEMRPMHAEWQRTFDTGVNMVVWAHPESGKSQQFCIGRVLHLLGSNPRKRIAILAAAESQVKKLIGSLRRHIETNQTLHQIFPNLRRGDLWTDRAITVARPGIIKDPSVQAISPNGEVQGARLDYLFIDDVLVEDNTRTAYQREKVATWIKVSAMSRLAHHAQVVLLANAFHPDDYAHQCARLGWWARKYPVLDEAGRSTWPNKFPLSRIRKIRNTEMGPDQFNRMHLCKARSDEDARFQEAWIEKCKLRGVGFPMFKDLRELYLWVGRDFWVKRGLYWDFRGKAVRLPDGMCTITGVDLGVTKKDSGDPTVIFTLLLWPDGTRQVLDVQRGRWQGPEIMRRIIATHQRFQSYFFVEDNAAQDYLVQFLAEDHPEIRVKGFRTGVNKHSSVYGVESIAGELEMGDWLIPCTVAGLCHKNVQIWIQEMLYFSPEGHTGDALMASWFAREAARAFQAKTHSSGAGVRVIG